MRKSDLGNTGICVTELCFGVLPMGPNQYGLSPETGGSLIKTAIERGVNFFDTAQSYRTYPHIKAAFDRLPDKGEGVVISTKSAAKSYDDRRRQWRRQGILDRMLSHIPPSRSQS